MSESAGQPGILPVSERLQFRHWSPDDLDLALGLWGDPLVSKFIDVRRMLSDREVREMLERHLGFQKQHGVQYWPMFSRASGQHVGCCGLRPRDPSEGIYELGCQIRSTHWGRGFATEASWAAIRFAFEVLGAKSLFAGHHPRSSVSGHLLPKLGFVYTHDELYPPTGLMHPSYRLEAARYLESTEE